MGIDDEEYSQTRVVGLVRYGVGNYMMGMMIDPYEEMDTCVL